MARTPFLERLKQGPLLGDGAMGTLLHSKGASLNSSFDALNLLDPDLVTGIHREYVQAGAELLETNTFGANRYKLREHGLEDALADINHVGVELARKVVHESPREDVYVAASVGPLGVRLAPYGRVQPEQAYVAFREQIEALCHGGPDLIILETFSDLYELREAVRAARDACDKPVVATLTFTRDDRTLLGDSPAQVADALAELDVDVLGANCSGGPAQLMRVLRAMQNAAPERVLWARPNAGWPEQAGGRVMYPAGSDYFGDYALAFRELGVTVIGGCCGTTPAHIQAMRAALDDPSRTATSIEVVQEANGPQAVSGPDEPTELARKLETGHFCVSVEMPPPRGIAPDKVVAGAQMLKEAGATVINVSDSPMARMRMSPWAVCHLIQRDVGIETVLHFPTRGRNLLRVQSDLLAAHALGVRNLFAVMGDPTHIGDYPDATDNYDLVPSGLVRLIKHNLNVGRDQAGNAIGQPTAFHVACALNMNPPDPEREMRVLRKKIEAGADFALTQPIFDAQIARDFLARYVDQYGPLELPILAGLLPLYSIRNARFLHNEIPGINIPDATMARMESAGEDAPQEGVRIAQELTAELREVVQGLYLMPAFKRYDLVAEVIDAVYSAAPA
jgi:homocysteine S-methyltransferase